MPVTAKDIAGRLGLSQPTVSRILNGSNGYRVAPKTKQLVIETARQMGYRPNAVARSLRHRRTNIVGFYTGYYYLNARNAYLASLIGGLQRACDLARLDILMHGVFRGRSTEDIYGELADGRIDGLFLHTIPGDQLVGHLVDSSLPVVALSDAVPGLPSVYADDVGGVKLELDYLMGKGHRRIAYIAPDPRYVSVERRVSAYRQIMSEADLEEMVVRIEHEETHAVLDELSKCASSPSAVCCWNDLTAANLLNSCRQRRLRVPEDLAIVGFDGSLDGRIMSQQLTTVGVPWDELGERALEVLRAQIDKEPAASETCVDVRLLVGETA